MMVKRCVRAVLGLSLALVMAACNVGLGQEVDLEGPVLAITSHQNLDYVAETLTIAGTATDNQALGRVELRHVLSATESTLLANAVISSSTWSADISLPEGEQTIEAIAYDRAGNTSHLSKATRTLLVDTSPPFAEELVLVRENGFRGDLQLRETLEALDETEKENRDLFHNELVRFEASINEDYPLSSVSLHLHDESGAEVLVLENTGSNDKAPSFELTHADLVEADASYAGGIAYLRVTLEAADLASNGLDPDAEPNIDQFGWFAWYPEADTPHIIQNLAVDGDIQINAGNSLFFDFWDDDEIDTVHVAMLSPADWAAISGTTDAERLAWLESHDTERETLLGASLASEPANTIAVNFEVGDVSGEYRLVAMARDAKGDGMPVLWSSRVYSLHVSDEDAPVTFIETPQQNSVPAVTPAGDFTISGYTLDNRGATALYAAWIPVGSGVANSAVQEALAASSLEAGSKDSLANGVVIYRLALTAAADRIINGKTYKQHSFSLVLNIFDDFMYEGTLQNDEKNFIFFTRDADANEVFQTYKLLGDSALPTLSAIAPAGDLEVHNILDSLVLSFAAAKDSGLAINSMVIEDYTDSSNPSTLFEGVEVDTASVTIEVSDLEEGRRTYRYTATDALGNTATAQRTVIISSLPVLEFISSSRADGTYKAGDELIFLAKFSKAVKVTGSPRLRLRYSDLDATDKFATYSSGSGTDTLFFSWTVPAGASSADLRSHSAPIDLNGGVIQTNEDSGGVAFIAGLGGQPDLGEADLLHGRKDIVLDGIAPMVTGLTFLPSSGSFRAGQSLELTLQVSEEVLVSGSPELLLTGDSASDITASFQKVEGGDDILFTLTVAAGQNAANLAYNLNACIAAGDLPLVTDLAGNPLVLPAGSNVNSGVVIDTSAPLQPAVTGVTDGATYNAAVTIGLDNLEAGSTRKYSLDGGTSWNDYTAPVEVSTDGSYTFVAWQEDAAGNRSPSSTPISFELDVSLPSVTGISCETPDGSYGAGTLLRFKLAFSEKVRTTGAGASITIGGTKLVPVTENGTGATSLVFDYTVAVGDSFDPVTVSEIDLANIVDLNGNAPMDLTPTPPSLSRPGLSADALDPAPLTLTPADGAVATVALAELEMIFDGPVFVEQGVIEVTRPGAWYLPLYFTEAEFSSIYYSSALDNTDREKLMITEGGSLHYLTGQSLGPYRKTTQGLVTTGTDAVPDTATKYVLDFPFSSAGTESVDYVIGDVRTKAIIETRTITGAEIRAVLEKAGYQRYSVDVGTSAVAISGSTVSITLPQVLPEGREWMVSVPAGAFRDAAGNTNEAFTWNFWSQKVAIPVIRVDRYSQGEGARQPLVSGLAHDVDGIVTNYGTIDSYETFSAQDKTTVPAGYVQVRIDCETPGATIRYGARRYSTATINTGGVAANESAKSDNADMPSALLIDDLQADYLSSDTTYSGIFALGDGALDTACKYYIVAEATRGAVPEGPALNSSARGVEGAFKSIIMYRNPGSGGSYTRFQGSNLAGGLPTVSGFPLRDADPDLRFTKHSYELVSDGDTDWYWHSWEIVCDWWNQSARTNWQSTPNLIFNTYGDYLYCNTKTYYGGGSWTDAM